MKHLMSTVAASGLAVLALCVALPGAAFGQAESPSQPAGVPPAVAPAPSTSAPAPPSAAAPAPPIQFPEADRAEPAPTMAPDVQAPATASAPVEARPAATTDAPDTECPVDWIATTLRRARSATVWVETPFTGAAGILVSPRRVATSTRIFGSRSGPLRVRLHDGQERDAELVHFDEATRLALLELEEAVEFTPLEIANVQALRVGMPMLVMGQRAGRFSGEQDLAFTWPSSTGYISDVREDRFSVAASVAWGYLGGPVLGCDGRWYGMTAQVHPTVSGALPAPEIQRVVRDAEASDGTPTGWALTSSRVGFAMDMEDEIGLIGASLGTSLTYADPEPSPHIVPKISTNRRCSRTT